MDNERYRDTEKRLDKLIAEQQKTNKLLEALVTSQVGKGKAGQVLEQIRTGKTEPKDKNAAKFDVAKAPSRGGAAM